MKGRLIALSSAAVLAVYTAGYARTRSAAEMLDAEERRPPMPRPGSVDRTPIPATPQDPALVPVAAASVPPAAPTRGVVAEPIDTSRRTPEAAPDKRAGRELTNLAASVASAPPRDAAPVAVAAAAAPAPPSSVAPLVPQAPVSAVASESGPAPAPVVAVAQAPVAPAVPATPAVPAGPKWKDGRYTGWGTSRHGDLQATVLVEAGRISTASISQCLTRYPCDWISKLPPQVIQRQSAEVDYVSGATESATAFYYAVLQALSKAAAQ